MNIHSSQDSRYSSVDQEPIYGQRLFCCWHRYCYHSVPCGTQRWENTMQLGMIGLGRMGANMALRLLHAGHACIGYDVHQSAVNDLRHQGADGAATLEELVG